ncbi:hypothetical protein EDD21DRAFT_156644, partial [Dissophora ornata]
TDRSFSRFVHDLPATNRAILLDLFSLCADVTLLAHLNNMTLVTVAKAISLSIMAEPEREFTTFDASLQQRNMWGAACEDLLRAFLRIKTTYDLAKIEHEDAVDENRYVDNITRKVKSARNRSNDNGSMPSIQPHSHSDVSLPSSAGSNMTPTATAFGQSSSGYFDNATTPRSASPLSQESLSRSHSLAKSTSSRSRPISPAPYHEQDPMEYEEIMQDRSHLSQLRQSRSSQMLRPTSKKDRRRSSVTDLDSLYMLPVESSTDGGYESEPEPMHSDAIPDFADGLGWDFSKMDRLSAEELPSLGSSQVVTVSRSNSSTSSQLSNNDSGQKQLSAPIRIPAGESFSTSPPHGTIQRSATSTNARVGHAIAPGHTSPSLTPQRAKRNSLLRRSVSLDPHTMHGRVHKKPNELRQDILTREMAIQAERSQVSEDIRLRLLQAKQNDAQEVPSSPRSTFSLESSPQDLERPLIPTRSASHGLGRSMSRTTNNDAKLEINVGSVPSKQSTMVAMDELTPVSNPSSNSSIASPRPQRLLPNPEKKSEVVARPTKDAEVSVHFMPITPVSPKAELKSKFQENFSDAPVSPPQGYVQGHSGMDAHKRSPSGKNGQSSKMSPSSSAISSPKQSSSMSRSNSKGQGPLAPDNMLPLQQSVSFSGISVASSQNSSTEGKSKAAGFIRALSFKLRSKPSDEQLKATKINNQVVGSAPVPPVVSIQPPRLELSFLGESPSGGSSSAAVHPQNSGVDLPPKSAPATMLNGSSISGAATLESWKRAAQDSMRVQPASAKGFAGARRTSGALSSSGNVALREQRRKSKISALSPRASPSGHASSQAKADGKRNGGSGDAQSSGRSPHRLATGRTLSDSSYTTDDSGSFDDATTATTSPKKAGEREYRFSTATLLKDGKLYYQLQWDSFSEAGFQSDFFHQPEQYLTGLHQKRMSKMPVGGPGVNSSAAAGNANMTLPPTSSTTSWDHAREGHLGQGQDRGMDPGPSEAQRKAAMKAARQSFMALAKDPRALAALKAGSTGGIGQATIIGTGSFPIGSTQPVLQNRPLNMNLDGVSTKTLSPSSQQDSSRSSTHPPHSIQEDAGKLQKSMSGKSLSTSSAAATASSDSRKEIAKPGKPFTTAGGVGLLSSSPLEQNPAADRAEVMASKRNRLFGVSKPKATKKTNRLSTIQGNNSPAGMMGSNFSNTNLTKKKKLPPGVVRKDVLTKTEESLDEVFPWMCIEHMAGQESGWVMLEPVQDGAVGWVKIEKLEEEINRLAEAEQKQQRLQQEQQQQQQIQHQMMEREQ